LEENKLNATTQQFITAKRSGCGLKQGSKTHSSLRQSNLQLQNEGGAHPGLQDRILLNYTRIGMKLHKNWECA